MEAGTPTDLVHQDWVSPAHLATSLSLTSDARGPALNLETLLAVAFKSAFMRAMFEECEPDIYLSSQVEHCELRVDTNTILFNKFLPFEKALAHFIKKLRILYRGYPSADLDCDGQIVANRIDLADQWGCMLRFGWELKLLGEPALWNAIDWRKKEGLAGALRENFRVINSGEMNFGSLWDWVEVDAVVNRADKAVIQRCLADYDLSIGKRSVAISDIQRLTKLPDLKYSRSQYIQQPHIILKDPLFTDVRDRSNANFLWFIKFELSFKEAEKELSDE